MKRLLIHHVDLDGLGILVLERVYHDKLGFDFTVALDYDFENNPETTALIESFDEIVIADLSSSQEYFLRLTRDLKKKVTVYDHHASSAYLDDYRGNIHDESRCGTRIFFEEYVVPRVKRLPQVAYDFVDRVDTYDRWQIESSIWEEALSLNRVLYGTMDYTRKEVVPSAEPFLRIETRKLRESSEWSWTPTEVQVIDRAVEAEDKRFFQAKRSLSQRRDKKGNIFGVFSLPGKISIVCSRILRDEKFEHLDYVVVVNSYGGINGNISVRSAKGFDCTQLGPVNGHLAAAGGALSPEDAELFLKDPARCLSYKEDQDWIDNQISVISS